MKAKPQFASNNSGFSLIEVMVGLIIGLLTIVVIMQTYGAFEGQKRTTTSGMDAQQNGLFSLHTMQTDLRMAGRGMIVDGAVAFSNVNIWRGGGAAAGAVTMVPVSIVDGGSGANNSDILEVVYSNSSCAGAPMRIAKAMPTASNVTTVGTGTCASDKDMIILVRPGSPGYLLKMTKDPQLAGGNTNLLTSSSASDGSNYWNPPGDPGYFPAGGYGVGAAIINMGQLVHNRYQVQCNTFTVSDRLVVTGAPSCTDQNTFANSVPLASSIVNIQAQFGIAPVGSQTISPSCWLDATSTSCTPTTTNWTAANLTTAEIARIKAVRVAIVARSSVKEKPRSGSTCDATTAAPTLFGGVSGAPVVNLSGDADWQCYRYQVYESIIPLRNIMWANI